jgi:hypothetical protein
VLYQAELYPDKFLEPNQYSILDFRKFGKKIQVFLESFSRSF